MRECLKCKKALTRRQRKYCSNLCKVNFFVGNKRKEFKSTTGLSYQSYKGVFRKMDIVLEMGGGCSMCGYNKNLSALEFHHLIPAEKNFQIDTRKIAGSSVGKINEELKKCILLCANCHQELHHPQLNMEVLKNQKREF